MVVGTDSPNRGLLLLQAINAEKAAGFECLALLRCRDACIATDVQISAYLHAANHAASERVYMALARVLDDDASSITAISFCRYMEQNPLDCAWIHSEAAKPLYPEPIDHVRQLARTWCKFWADHPLRTDVRFARDKALAHRDKKHWLDPVPFKAIPLPEVQAAFEALHKMICDFWQLIDNTHLSDGILPITLYEGALTLAAYDCWWKGLRDGSVDYERYRKRVEEIEKSLEI